jgi:hypothetical protein
MGAKRNSYSILVEKPEGKRPLGILRCKWADNIKILVDLRDIEWDGMDWIGADNIKILVDLREIEWDGMDWIDLAQIRDQWRALVNTVMNLRVL